MAGAVRVALGVAEAVLVGQALALPCPPDAAVRVERVVRVVEKEALLDTERVREGRALGEAVRVRSAETEALGVRLGAGGEGVLCALRVARAEALIKRGVVVGERVKGAEALAPSLSRALAVSLAGAEGVRDGAGVSVGTAEGCGESDGLGEAEGEGEVDRVEGKVGVAGLLDVG